jgi:hypothetical protein
VHLTASSRQCCNILMTTRYQHSKVENIKIHVVTAAACGTTDAFVDPKLSRTAIGCYDSVDTAGFNQTQWKSRCHWEETSAKKFHACPAFQRLTGSTGESRLIVRLLFLNLHRKTVRIIGSGMFIGRRLMCIIYSVSTTE